jgi:integrase
LLEQHPAPTTIFAEALAVFLSVHCSQKNKPRTAAETERLLRRHFTSLKSKQLGDISHHHITGIIDGLLDTPSEANYAFTAIRTFFRFAVRRRFISRSPAEGLQIPSRVVARERVLTDHELVKVWNAAAEIGYPFGTIVQLLILTGQRRGEIASMGLDCQSVCGRPLDHGCSVRPGPVVPGNGCGYAWPTVMCE